MRINDIPKSQVARLLDAIKDLRPAMKISVISEDVSLYQLGFADEVPCTIQIDETEETIDALVEEIDQMEIDAYNNTGVMTAENKTARERYERYSIIEAYLSGRY